MDLVSESLAELIGVPGVLGVDEPVLLGCVRLAAQPESVAEARRITVAIIARLRLGAGFQEDAELIVSELVTNAVVHGATAHDPHVLLVLMQSGRKLRVKVYDASSDLGRRREPRSDAESGRGLVIVDALSDRWGATASAYGKCLWAELDVGTVLPDGPEA